MKELTQEDFDDIANELFSYAKVLKSFAFIYTGTSLCASISQKADEIYALACRIPVGEATP